MYVYALYKYLLLMLNMLYSRSFSGRKTLSGKRARYNNNKRHISTTYYSTYFVAPSLFLFHRYHYRYKRKMPVGPAKLKSRFDSASVSIILINVTFTTAVFSRHVIGVLKLHRLCKYDNDTLNLFFTGSTMVCSLLF